MKIPPLQNLSRHLPLALILTCVCAALYIVVSAYLKTIDRPLTQERIVAQVEHVDQSALLKFTTERERLSALSDDSTTVRDPFPLDAQ